MTGLLTICAVIDIIVILATIDGFLHAHRQHKQRQRQTAAERPGQGITSIHSGGQ